MTTLTKPTARAASTALAFEHASDLAASADNAIKRMCDFFAALIGIILLYFIAGKVRKSNKVTVPEIMGARYGQSARHHFRGVRHAGLCGRIGHSAEGGGRHSGPAVQLQRCGDLPWLALVICTTITCGHHSGGGLVSVAYSDAISALIMIGGFFIAIPILISVANAQGAVLPPEKTTLTGGMSGWELLGYFLPSLALMLGDQNMLQRFASAKNSTEPKSPTSACSLARSWSSSALSW